MKLGNRIKAMLKFRHLQQKDLAKGIGASQVLVSRWCKNVLQPKLKHAKKIADFFGITMEMLLGSYKLFDDLLDEADCRLL